MIPPTPANWKRKMNSTIETPTPTKRRKPDVQRLNSTVGTPNFATPSNSGFRHHNSSVKKALNMDHMLQNIDEEEQDSKLSPSASNFGSCSDISSAPITSSVVSGPSNVTQNMNNTLMDASLLSPMMRKFTEQLEQRFFSRFEQTIRDELRSVRRSPRLKEKVISRLTGTQNDVRASITEMVEQNLRNNPGEGLEDLITTKSLQDGEKNAYRERHLRKVEATASPNLRRSMSDIEQDADKENATPENTAMEPKTPPTVKQMETALGLNFESPGLDVFESPSSNKPSLPPTGKKRSIRRTTMMSNDLAKSIRESGVFNDVTNNRRRSTRIASKLSTKDVPDENEEKRKSDFKQPLQVTKNWKVTNQESHNSSMLKLLNTANLAMLQSIPAIGPKTAYILHSHRCVRPFRLDVKFGF